MKTLRTHLYLEQSNMLMDIIMLIAGALLPLAFAPENIYILAFVCPLLLLIGLRDSTVKRALWRGWLFGFGFFVVGVSWVYVSIHTYGNTSFIIAGILTLLFVSGLALLFALQAFCFVYFFAKKHWLSLTVGFASCWVLAEILRSWLLTGFPWLLLGNSQLHTWLSGYAPLVSVYGVSFIVACTSGFLLTALRNSRCFIGSLIIIILFFAIGFNLMHIQWTKPIGKPLTVSLVQGNVARSLKWDPKHLSLSLNRYQKLAEQNWQSQLIVFPEGAIPDNFIDQRPFFKNLNKEAKQHKSTIISGVILTNSKTEQAFNSIIAIGKGRGLYLKQHLVPFGEYVPFQHLLRGLIGFFNLPMSNLSPGPKYQPLIQIGSVKIASFLCYEIAYLNLMLPTLPQAELLMNLSDDSWFGHSWAAAQQLQISQMRSLEAGREQMVVGNSGFTAIINAHGKIIKKAPRDIVTVLRGRLQPMQGYTPLAYLGSLSELIVLLLTTLFCWLFARKRRYL